MQTVWSTSMLPESFGCTHKFILLNTLLMAYTSSQPHKQTCWQERIFPSSKKFTLSMTSLVYFRLRNRSKISRLFSPMIFSFFYESRTLIFCFRIIKRAAQVCRAHSSSSLITHSHSYIVNPKWFSTLIFLPFSTQFKIQIPPTGNFSTFTCRVCVYFTPPLSAFAYNNLMIRQSFNIAPCVSCLVNFFFQYYRVFDKESERGSRKRRRGGKRRKQ